MAAAAPSPGIDSSLWSEEDHKTANARRALLGILRCIGAEAQNIQRCAECIRDAGTIADATSRASEVMTLTTRLLPQLHSSTNQITDLLEDARQLITEFPVLYDAYGDSLQNIKIRQRSIDQVIPGTQEEPAEILRKLEQIVSDARVVIYYAGLITFPHRINQHLETVRVGKVLDFHAMFGDEMPNPEDRIRFLEYLVAHPGAISGIVDASQGLIQRAAQRRWRRMLSYVLIVLILALLLVLAYFIPSIADEAAIDEFEADVTGRRMLIGGIAAFLGGFVHLGIDGLKQIRDARARGTGLPYAIGDWTLWIHVNELGVITSIVGVWIGYVGIVVILDRVDFIVAFLVGYSSDSFVDLFLQRFTTTVSARTSTLQEQLG